MGDIISWDTNLDLRHELERCAEIPPQTIPNSTFGSVIFGFDIKTEATIAIADNALGICIQGEGVTRIERILLRSENPALFYREASEFEEGKVVPDRELTEDEGQALVKDFRIINTDF